MMAKSRLLFEKVLREMTLCYRIIIFFILHFSLQQASMQNIKKAMAKYKKKNIQKPWVFTYFFFNIDLYDL